MILDVEEVLSQKAIRSNDRKKQGNKKVTKYKNIAKAKIKAKEKRLEEKAMKIFGENKNIKSIFEDLLYKPAQDVLADKEENKSKVLSICKDNGISTALEFLALKTIHKAAQCLIDKKLGSNSHATFDWIIKMIHQDPATKVSLIQENFDPSKMSDEELEEARSSF